MHMKLDRDTPEDCVSTTGETHSVGEFYELAFAEVGLDCRDCLQENPQFYRTAEFDLLVGDASKAERFSVGSRFLELVRQMVEHDLAKLSGLQCSRKAAFVDRMQSEK